MEPVQKDLSERPNFSTRHPTQPGYLHSRSRLALARRFSHCLLHKSLLDLALSRKQSRFPLWPMNRVSATDLMQVMLTP